MSQLQIRLFGGFQVHLNEQPIRFPTQKVRALFAYLSVEAKSAHPREKLMTLFWPEQSQNSASNNLRQTLSRLRSVLPADTLLIRDNEIQFNLKSSHRVDVTAFVQAFSAKTPDDVVAASELYQGDFLAHFSLPDSPIFEEWALLKREWLRSEALKMLHHLTLAYEQAERHEDAIHAARRQVEIDSLHEVAWQQLMRNLALAGRRSEALDQFELCRQILEKELEVEPAQETTQLAQQIRAGGFAPKSIGQPSQLTSLNETVAPTRLFNLPTPLTPLVGREVELARLAELLAESSIRLLTILGPGGMGKTHLALAAVAAEKEHFANGVAFVSLAPLQSSEAVVSAIAASLRFSFHNNGDPLSQLRDYLREKAFLLLLDNFEHLLSATAILIDLLEHAPRLKCLATSRVALGTIGEQLFMLDGVTVPPSDPKTLAEVDHYGAVRLFVQSAKRLNPAFRLDTQVQPAVIAICRHVQGMPLGILLATAWLQTLSLDEIVAQLNSERRDSASERLDFWEADQPAITSQQRSLRTVFARSWRLLGERERRAFQRLSIFRGGFSTQAAKAVADVTIHDLRTLVNQSLVRRAENGRYDMHELVRQYAAERLAADESEQQVWQSYTTHFAQFMHQRAPRLIGPEQQIILSEIESESENILQTWFIAVKQTDFQLLDQLAQGIARFYDLKGRFQEAREIFHNACLVLLPNQTIEDVYPANGLRVCGRIFALYGSFLRVFEQTEELDTIYQLSEKLLHRAELLGEDIRSEQAFLLLLKSHRASRENAQTVIKLASESLELYQQIKDLDGIASAYGTIGSAHYTFDGSTRKYKEFTEKRLAILMELGDSRSMAFVLDQAALTELEEFRLEAAIEMRQQALVIAGETGNKADLATLMTSYAITLNLCGYFQESHNITKDALKIWTELGSLGQTIYALDEHNYSGVHLGIYKEALQSQLDGIRLCDITQDIHWKAGMYSLIGMIFAGTREFTRAKEEFAIGFEMAKDIKYNSVIALDSALMCYPEYHLGNLKATKECALRNCSIGLQINHRWMPLHSFPAIALVYADEGKQERAIELYTVAWRWKHIANSRWYEDLAGRKLAAFQATLLPELVERARKRGEAVDMWEAVKQLHDELQAELANSGQ